MRRVLICSLAVGASALAYASDHNNIEAGRPLRFDDAYSIAFRERAFEFGLSLDSFRRQAPSYGLKSEFKYGFSKNQDIAIAFEPTWSGSSRKFDPGNLELSYFHGLAREIENAPAIAYRVDLGLPTGKGARGIDMHFRGIATKSLGQYDKLHLNVDLGWMTHPSPGERRNTFGAVLGYSAPLGYPRRFDQTLVGELSVKQSTTDGEGYIGSAGIGLRRQMSPQSVLDIGLATDLFSTQGAKRSTVRLVIGFSIGF
jgi:hypothetical protein